MALQAVQAFFEERGRKEDVMEFASSSATVDQAADTLGVKPARIAKTLSFRAKDGEAFLVVTSGETRIDNRKFRDTYGFKARMLAPDEVLEETGHAIGGVCPFGLKQELEVFLDVSLKRFDTVYPACGSTNSAIELTIGELMKFSSAKGWVDIAKGWETESAEEVALTSSATE